MDDIPRMQQRHRRQDRLDDLCRVFFREPAPVRDPIEQLSTDRELVDEVMLAAGFKVEVELNNVWVIQTAEDGDLVKDRRGVLDERFGNDPTRRNSTSQKRQRAMTHCEKERAPFSLT